MILYIEALYGMMQCVLRMPGTSAFCANTGIPGRHRYKQSVKYPGSAAYAAWIGKEVYFFEHE